jgi:hypothetical protein
MRSIHPTLRIALAAVLAAAVLAACHDDTTTIPPATAQQANLPFSVFVNQLFTAGANSKPASLDGLSFNYDVDDDPTAFDALIMTGTY